MSWPRLVMGPYQWHLFRFGGNAATPFFRKQPPCNREEFLRIENGTSQKSTDMSSHGIFYTHHLTAVHAETSLHVKPNLKSPAGAELIEGCHAAPQGWSKLGPNQLHSCLAVLAIGWANHSLTLHCAQDSVDSGAELDEWEAGT